MTPCHVGLQLCLRHCHDARGSDHPRLLPLPEGFPLSVRTSLIGQLPPLTPDETRVAHHHLGSVRVCLYPHLLKQSYLQSRDVLNPLMILTRYPSVFRIKNKLLSPLSHTPFRAESPTVCIPPQESHVPLHPPLY